MWPINPIVEPPLVWKLMHLQPLYKGTEYISKEGVDVSGRLFADGLCLPSGSSLTMEDQDRIIDIIFSLVK